MPITESKSIPRCFIIGAGASCDAGYPLVNCFITTLDGWLNKATNSEFNQQTDVPNLNRYKNELRPAIEKTKAGMQEKDRDNIERLLENLKKSNFQSYLLFEKIIYWMFFHFAHNGEVYDSSYFDYFFSKTRPGDCVISFNYDLLLEQTLRNHGILYTYNWNDAQKVRILKPHGAINLITNLDEHGYIDINRSNGTSSKKTTTEALTRVSEYFDGNIGHEIWDTFNNKTNDPNFYWNQIGSKDKQSILILPELKKDEILEHPDYKFLNLTWKSIPDVLASFQELWVIGYNFSESDEMAVDTIGPYLKGKARQVYVVDPYAESRFLKELCAIPKRVKHFPTTFKKFVDSEDSDDDPSPNNSDSCK